MYKSKYLELKHKEGMIPYTGQTYKFSRTSGASSVERSGLLGFGVPVRICTNI